jgi:hypothetical protein
MAWEVSTGCFVPFLMSLNILHRVVEALRNSERGENYMQHVTTKQGSVISLPHGCLKLGSYDIALIL